MDDHTVFQRNDDFIARQMGDELLLVPISQAGADIQKIYSLNKTAADIWNIFAEKTSLEELLLALSKEYDKDPAELKTDIMELLDDLLKLDALRKIEG